MMTAKEMCEEFKNKQLTLIIKAIKYYDGNLKIASKYFDFYGDLGNGTIDILGNFYISYNEFISNEKALKELGYKVTKEKIILKHKRKEKVKTWFIFSKNIEVEKQEEAELLTISACCGEE